MALQGRPNTAVAAAQSLSVGGALGGRKAQQLFELAYNPSEMRARLSGIPVYTVANKDSREFVLVSGVVSPCDKWLKKVLGAHILSREGHWLCSIRFDEVLSAVLIIIKSFSSCRWGTV